MVVLDELERMGKESTDQQNKEPRQVNTQGPIHRTAPGPVAPVASRKEKCNPKILLRYELL
jgi:hypothetical protein